MMEQLASIKDEILEETAQKGSNVLSFEVILQYVSTCIWLIKDEIFGGDGHKKGSKYLALKLFYNMYLHVSGSLKMRFWRRRAQKGIKYQALNLFYNMYLHVPGNGTGQVAWMRHFCIFQYTTC